MSKFYKQDYIRIQNPICPCGKVGFDKKGAQSKRNQLIKMGKEKDLRIYQCNVSDLGYWHITSQFWDKKGEWHT